jgi:hypothetical protein
MKKGIVGNVFIDKNRNCIKYGAEAAVSCFKLFDNANNLIAKSFPIMMEFINLLRLQENIE